MVDLFVKYSDAVLREYVKLNKPVRTYLDEHLDCSNCLPEDCCCIDDYTGLDLFTAWDHFVFKREHPDYMETGYEQDEGDPVCAYLSETGCTLSSPRPSTCIRYVCPPKRKKLINYKRGKVLTTVHRISLDMQKIMVDMLSLEQEERIIHDIDECLKDASKIIKKDKLFSEKYEYESIF